VAVVTVLFPTLSRFAAVGNLQAYRATVDGGLRQIAFLLVPAAVVGAVLAQPIVRLLYERGAFTADNTVVVAQCLAAFSLGLTFNGWMLLLSRGFYSLQRNWVPTAVALGTVGLNAVLDALLYRLGVWGIPLSTSLVNIAGVGILLAVMRRSPGLAGARGVLVSVVRILAASALAAAAAYGVWWALDELLGRDLWAQIVSLGAGLAAGGAVYLAAARLLGVRELEALRALRRGRHGD
jgi:putative peptidoglycan lipid II flippase